MDWSERSSNGGTARLGAAYCRGDLHIRVWAGGPEAKPKFCACGQVQYEPCACKDCGDSHERLVVVKSESVGV